MQELPGEVSPRLLVMHTQAVQYVRLDTGKIPFLPVLISMLVGFYLPHRVVLHRPQLVLVFQKSASHMFFEKTAEIAGFQKCSPGYKGK